MSPTFGSGAFCTRLADGRVAARRAGPSLSINSTFERSSCACVRMLASECSIVARCCWDKPVRMALAVVDVATAALTLPPPAPRKRNDALDPGDGVEFETATRYLCVPVLLDTKHGVAAGSRMRI